ncbi:MAG TPA: PHB depolymerase family esterase [Caulobacteraceae bacterium]|jgi:feruloyl esterase
MTSTLARPTASAPPRLRPTPVFGDNPGGLRMWSWTPVDIPRGAPLVVVLHGCGQSAQGFAVGTGWLTLAQRRGFALLAPEQTRANNPGRCFNWFEPQDTARGRGEAASVRAMIERMFELHRLDRRRVFVTGLSAGGCMALALMAAYPELFEAGAVIAAAPVGAASNLREAMIFLGHPRAVDERALAAQVRAASGHTGRWPRLAIWQGQADRTVAPANAHAIAAQWLALQGLSDQPPHHEESGPVRRSVWTDRWGKPLVELDLVEGLGHGAPIAAFVGPEALGRPGAFLLEAGVSSTLEIARFFGLTRDVEPVAGSSAPEPGPLGALRRLWRRLTRPA